MSEERGNPTFSDALRDYAFKENETNGSLNKNSDGISPEDRKRIYEEEKAREEARNQIKGQQTLRGCGGCIVIIILAWLFASFACPSNVSTGGNVSSSTNWRAEDNSLMAYIMIEDFVKERLVSPGSARFPGIFDGKADHITYLGNQRYRIVSWVDSQNAFGASLRTYFTAEIEQTGEETWRLISLEME